MKEIYYYCDCTKSIKNAQQGKGRMGLTEVDTEGICKKCGHYAMAFDRKVDNIAKGGLYFALFGKAGVTPNGKRKQKKVLEGKGYAEDYYEEHRLLF